MYSDKKSCLNFQVNILISLEILKHLFGLTDEQLIDNFHYNLQFMYVLGIQKIGEFPQ
ncbi:transposase [Anoxybacter fermentans]|uniref:transposase n=1 Tax=Anoxybacter fermentans TaxID=1323375 RepID=UPI000F8D4E3B